MAAGGRSNTLLLCFRGAGGGVHPRQELYSCGILSAVISQNGYLLNLDLLNLFLLSNCYILTQGAPRKARPTLSAFMMDSVKVGMAFLICFLSRRFRPMSRQEFCHRTPYI